MTLRAAVAAALVASLQAPARPGADPAAFFGPAVRLTTDELRRIEAGEAVVKVLDARGRDLAIFSAARIDAGGDRLVAWIRRVDDLKRSSFVPQIGRFSTPPRLDDVRDLTLDEEDLADLRRCRRGDCDLKLSAPEIARVGEALAAAPGDWRAAGQQVFRAIVVERARAYLDAGLPGLPPYHDRATPVSMHDEFRALLEASPYLAARLPRLADHLRGFPSTRSPDVESLLYWSKETLGGKPIVSVTHVNIVRSDDPALPEALVAAKQVFATHYLTGSLAITAIVGGAGPHRHLVYLNRSRLDVLEGFWGGFVRRIAERRLRGEAADVVQGLRRRLEGGDPPGSR